MLLFLNRWFSDEVLKAICWTLIHSLWQGLLAAAVAGLVIISTGKSSARLRYNLLGGVMMLFLTVSIITLCRQLTGNAFSGQDLNTRVAPGLEISSLNGGHNVHIGSPGNFMDEIATYFNVHAGFFVLIWALLFLFNCIKLAVGFANIYKFNNHKTYPLASDWKIKVDNLRKVLGIHRAVSLIQSGFVKVPATIGFFKPVILVPLGLLANLPPAQVETILLHELAHIRRKDYIVNLLQRLAEAIFFFNPGFVWIATQLRQEREVCCDEIVFANATDKGSYLEALVSFQEYSIDNFKYVMALGNNRNSLLDRVKRMLTRENKKLNPVEKIILLLGLTVITAFNFLAKNEKTPVEKPSSIPQIKRPAKIDPPAPPQRIGGRLQNENKIAVLYKIQKRDTIPCAEPSKGGINRKKNKVQKYSRLFSLVNNPVVNEMETRSDIINQPPPVLRKKINIPRLAVRPRLKNVDMQVDMEKLSQVKIEIDKMKMQMEQNSHLFSQGKSIRFEDRRMEIEHEQFGRRAEAATRNYQNLKKGIFKSTKMDLQPKIDVTDRLQIHNTTDFDFDYALKAGSDKQPPGNPKPAGEKKPMFGKKPALEKKQVYKL